VVPAPATADSETDRADRAHQQREGITMTSTPSTHPKPVPWRAKAIVLAAAALGLAATPGLASASAATVPTITSVTFSSGSAVGSTTPLVTIDGTGFGTLPNPSPGGDPQAEFGDCGSPSGYDGLDFGSHLQFNELSSPGAFEAGNGTQGNCVGLVIWEYTPTQIQYGFGSVYAGFPPGLQNGDKYSVRVKGASASGTVSFSS
jgi:hypothetical protein